MDKNKTNKHDELLENEDLRKKLIDKIEVLNKVKELILLPNTELMTTRMVADYYEVSQDVIRKTIERNKDEIIANGMEFKKYKEIKEMTSNDFNSDRMSQLKISRQGTNVFSRRAVLNIGMLLRDSDVAKRIRTMLLDTFESSTIEQRTSNMTKETELIVNIIMANNKEDEALALADYRKFKDAHINSLKETIEEQRPKVDKYGRFIDSNYTYSFEEVAKMLSTRSKDDGYDFNVTKISLPSILREQGILSKAKKGNGYRNLPNKDFEGYFNVLSRDVKGKNFAVTQTRVKANGLDFIYDFLIKYFNNK